MITIGCAGFPVPATRYFKEFLFVEVQDTHVTQPGTGTIRRWRREAPPGFAFAMLAPKDIGTEGFREGKVTETALKNIDRRGPRARRADGGVRGAGRDDRVPRQQDRREGLPGRREAQVQAHHLRAAAHLGRRRGEHAGRRRRGDGARATRSPTGPRPRRSATTACRDRPGTRAATRTRPSSGWARSPRPARTSTPSTSSRTSTCSRTRAASRGRSSWGEAKGHCRRQSAEQCSTTQSRSVCPSCCSTDE